MGRREERVGGSRVDSASIKTLALVLSWIFAHTCLLELSIRVAFIAELMLTKHGFTNPPHGWQPWGLGSVGVWHMDGIPWSLLGLASISSYMSVVS